MSSREFSPTRWFFVVISMLLAGTAGAGQITVPVSTLLIEGQVAFDDRGSVRFSLLEGAMLSVETDTAVYCLIPHLLDRETNRVRFDSYIIVGREGKRDILQALGSLTLRGSETEETVGNHGILSLELNAIRESGMTRDELDNLRSEVTAKPGPLLRDPAI